jgi:hypothetical protein
VYRREQVLQMIEQKPDLKAKWESINNG